MPARRNIRRNLGPSTGRHRRRYVRLWARLRRQDRAYRLRSAARAKNWREANPEKHRAVTAAWRQQPGVREHLRRYNRRYHRLYRARRCDFCGRMPRHASHHGARGCPGRGCGLQLVARLVPNTAGRLLPAKLRWCGKC